MLSDVRFICTHCFLHYLFDDFRLKSEQFRGQLVLTISFYSTIFNYSLSINYLIYFSISLYNNLHIPIEYLCHLNAIIKTEIL